ISNNMIARTQYIVPIMTNIVNSMLKLSHISDEWKSQEALLLLKKNKDPDDMSSYRCLSMVSHLAKIPEKVIKDLLEEHASKDENILHRNQFGFRRGKSSTDAVFDIKSTLEEKRKRNQLLLI